MVLCLNFDYVDATVLSAYSAAVFLYGTYLSLNISTELLLKP